MKYNIWRGEITHRWYFTENCAKGHVHKVIGIFPTWAEAHHAYLGQVS